MASKVELILKQLIDGDLPKHKKKLDSGLFLSYKPPDTAVPDTVRMHKLTLGRIGSRNLGRGRLLVFPSQTDVTIIENVLTGRWQLEGVIVGQKYRVKSIHPRTEEQLVFGCLDIYWPEAQPGRLFK